MLLWEEKTYSALNKIVLYHIIKFQHTHQKESCQNNESIPSFQSTFINLCSLIMKYFFVFEIKEHG